MFRNGAGSGSGGGHAFRARDRRGVQDRSSDRRFGGGSSEPNRKLFVKNVSIIMHEGGEAFDIISVS